MYVIDSADVQFIKDMINVYQIQGVTTNPTIICRENKAYYPLLKEIENALDGRDLHIQLTEESFEKMIEEAHNLSNIITKNLHIKIPVSKDGFKAIKQLSSEGYSVTATAVCTFNQGLMAALLGAEYIAVYVNRVSNTGIDGNNVLQAIKNEYIQRGITTKIIGASYKSVYQVSDSIQSGADQVTVGKDLFEALFDSEVTNKSITNFTSDFSKQYPKGV